jgi:hypothetical protein
MAQEKLDESGEEIIQPGWTGFAQRALPEGI